MGTAVRYNLSPREEFHSCERARKIYRVLRDGQQRRRLVARFNTLTNSIRKIILRTCESQ